MWPFIAVISCLVSLLLAVRLLRIRQTLVQMADAMEQQRPFLNERRRPWVHFFAIERVATAINNLVADTRGDTMRQRDHLSQLELTLGSIQEAVIIVDHSNQLVMANNAFKRLIGVEGDIIGRRLETIIQSEGLLDCLRAVKGARATGHIEAEITGPDGRTKAFEVSGVLIDSATSEHGYALCVMHDITRLRRLEKVRSDFVANVSHELRTPVTIIRGFTDTLVEEHSVMPDGSRERFLLKIQRNVSRLQRLLEDLLTLTRLESAQEAANLELVSARSLIRDVYDNSRERVEAADKTLMLDLSEQPDNIRVDTLRIGQVIDNLIDNALRHAHDMTTITISSQILGNQVRIAVEDNGCGIPPKDLPHVFERFYRVDKGRSRDSGGTGLGLSIVKHIILSHSGQVYAESIPGKFARIAFELPLETTRSDAPKPQPVLVE